MVTMTFINQNLPLIVNTAEEGPCFNSRKRGLINSPPQSERTHHQQQLGSSTIFSTESSWEKLHHVTNYREESHRGGELSILSPFYV